MFKLNRQLRKHWVFILVLAIFIGWVFYSYLTEGIFYLLATSDTNSIASFINSFGVFAAVIFILLVILGVVLAPVPPLVLYVAGGIIFGAFLGGTLTLVGNVLGAGVAFLIARKYGRNLVEEKISPKIRKKFDDFSKKQGPYALFLLRLNPFTTSDLFSYIAGLTKMKLRTFILATGLGLAPLIYLQTYIGDLFVRDNPLIFFIFIIINLLYLAFFLYGILYLVLKRRRLRRNNKVQTKHRPVVSH